MSIKEKILKFAEEKNQFKTSDIAKKFNVSRQHASNMIKDLVGIGKLIKFGSTRSAFYVLPEKMSAITKLFPVVRKRVKNKNLEEHLVINEIEKELPLLLELPENIRSIFIYAFSEMLNNAIEHSKTNYIDIEVVIKDRQLNFIVNDYGIGVFKNIMRKKKLKTELEAIQELLKGKTTTMPKSHSGEGIFFTSKIGDIFVLESFGYRLIINNKINDIFLQSLKKQKKGTKVSFSISLDTKKHLNDIFNKYASDNSEGPSFNKTEIKIKLFTIGGIFISRSQARRVLSGLVKFKVIILDFDKVPLIGQSFADEIFRVFKEKHPKIKIKPINMNEPVKFMVDRASK